MEFMGTPAGGRNSLVHFYFNYPKDLVANKKKKDESTFSKQLTKNK